MARSFSLQCQKEYDQLPAMSEKKVFEHLCVCGRITGDTAVV